MMLRPTKARWIPTRKGNRSEWYLPYWWVKIFGGSYEFGWMPPRFKNMKTLIAKIITKISFNKVRFIHKAHSGVESLRWFWTPWTYKFGHGGWVFLSPKWISRFSR